MSHLGRHLAVNAGFRLFIARHAHGQRGVLQCAPTFQSLSLKNVFLSLSLYFFILFFTFLSSFSFALYSCLSNALFLAFSLFLLLFLFALSLCFGRAKSMADCLWIPSLVFTITRSSGMRYTKYLSMTCVPHN